MRVEPGGDLRGMLRFAFSSYVVLLPSITRAMILAAPVGHGPSGGSKEVMILILTLSSAIIACVPAIAFGACFMAGEAFWCRAIRDAYAIVGGIACSLLAVILTFLAVSVQLISFREATALFLGFGVAFSFLAPAILPTRVVERKTRPPRYRWDP